MTQTAKLFVSERVRVAFDDVYLNGVKLHVAEQDHIAVVTDRIAHMGKDDEYIVMFDSGERRVYPRSKLTRVRRVVSYVEVTDEDVAREAALRR